MLARLRDLEARFSDVFWRELAPGLGIVRSSAREWQSSPIDADVGELSRRIGAIEAVFARWSAIDRAWARPSRRPPIGEGSSSCAIGDPTPDVAIAREDLGRWLRAMRIRLPLDVRVRPNGARVKWTLASSAPRGAGAVTIEPERLLDDLRKMAGVLTDIEVGDDRFDGVFLVRGHEPTARALLDVATRRRLLRLGARSAGLRVELDGGIALIQLHGAPDRLMLEDAVAVLRRVRRAPVRPLRRDR
jgi:hypothetical protein